MGQAAYDYNAVRRRKAPQTQRKANLRVAKGGKRRLTPLQAALNSKTNITSVEETAGRLGLMKIDQSQITYIRLGESDTLERTQSAVRQWTDFIYNGAVNILGTIR